MAPSETPFSPSGRKPARTPQFFVSERAWAEQQARLRQRLPFLWESCRKSQGELVEAELRRALALVHAAHESFREHERTFFLETRAECHRWQQRRDGLKRGRPGLLRALEAVLGGLEAEAQTGAMPLRPHLAFCFGGLRRLVSLPFSENEIRFPAPFAPVGVQEAGEETIAKTMADLRGKRLPHSPADLLGRIESVCAHWWYAQTQLTELYGRPAREMGNLATALRREFEIVVGRHILPVLDALEAALEAMAADVASARSTLLRAKTTLIDYLGTGEITVLEVPLGSVFDATRHTSGIKLSSGRGRVVKVLRPGYCAGADILRRVEVEVLVTE